MSSKSKFKSSQCPNCGEANPAPFELCWSCGTDLISGSSNSPPDEPTSSFDTKANIAPSPQKPVVADDQREVRSQSIAWTNWLELATILLITCVPRMAGHWIASSDDAYKLTLSTLALSIPRYCGFAILLWLLIRRDKSAIQPVELKKSNWLLELLFGLLIAAAGLMVGAAIASIGTRHGVTNVFQAPDPRMIEESVWISITYSLFAVIYEELLFRVYLQSKLQSLMPGKVVLSVLISAGLFAVVHGYPLRSSLKVFASGLIYGAVYQQRRRVPRIVLAHWFHNIFVTLL